RRDGGRPPYGYRGPGGGGTGGGVRGSGREVCGAISRTSLPHGRRRGGVRGGRRRRNVPAGAALRPLTTHSPGPPVRPAPGIPDHPGTTAAARRSSPVGGLPPFRARCGPAARDRVRNARPASPVGVLSASCPWRSGLSAACRRSVGGG